LPSGALHTDPDGKESTSTCTYDERGNLIKESYKEADGSETVCDYTCDDKGNAIKEIHTDEEGNVETKEVEYKLVYIAAETSKEIDRLLEFIY
jgi:hypothetical protein